MLKLLLLLLFLQMLLLQLLMLFLKLLLELLLKLLLVKFFCILLGNAFLGEFSYRSVICKVVKWDSLFTGVNFSHE